jgi:hypothetical protein
MWESEMGKSVFAPVCERGNDLIAFLYAEVEDFDQGEFEHHMQDCTACESAFAAFKEIRESVAAWRQESLGVVLSRSVVAETAVDPVILSGFGSRKPSALAAVREFFALSPLWMKGAVAFASVLFCLFAVLAVARLRETPRAPLAGGPNIKAFSDQELKAMIEQRAEEKFRELKAGQVQMIAVAPSNTPRRNTIGRIPGGPTALVHNPTLKTRLPLTKAEREQLAADLRLISPGDDADLDLLGDRLNRQD